jgi:formate dehydrogenase subunit gamma
MVAVTDIMLWNAEFAARIVAANANLEGPLLPILHALQEAFGCVPAEAVPFLAQALNLSRAEVYGVVSFYHDFRSEPAGRVLVKLCRAEACQSMGGPAAAEALLARCNLRWHETSADGALTIEPVYCLGLCAVAPAALINERLVGRAGPERLIEAVEAALG